MTEDAGADLRFPTGRAPPDAARRSTDAAEAQATDAAGGERETVYATRSVTGEVDLVALGGEAIGDGRRERIVGKLATLEGEAALG